MMYEYEGILTFDKQPVEESDIRSKRLHVRRRSQRDSSIIVISCQLSDKWMLKNKQEITKTQHWLLLYEPLFLQKATLLEGGKITKKCHQSQKVTSVKLQSLR